MKFTEQEIEIAKSICQKEEYLELIAKVFLEQEDKLTEDVVNSLTNEKLGEVVRANTLAELKVKNRFNNLKMISRKNEQKGVPTVKT